MRLIATSTTLTHLDIGQCTLPFEALRPLFIAVGRSKTLRLLRCDGNDIDAAVARFLILPMIQRNTSLRWLTFNQPDIPELVQAEALVAARRR